MGTNNTTIQIQTDTREVLKKIGQKGESYDKLVRRLIQQVEENNEIDL
jgi:predicted CopG family antitoxin